MNANEDGAFPSISEDESPDNEILETFPESG